MICSESWGLTFTAMDSYLKIRPTRDLPNLRGFKFLALDNEGTLAVKTVGVHTDGVFYVDGFETITGWLPIEGNKIELRRKL